MEDDAAAAIKVIAELNGAEFFSRCKMGGESYQDLQNIWIILRWGRRCRPPGPWVVFLFINPDSIRITL